MRGMRVRGSGNQDEGKEPGQSIEDESLIWNINMSRVKQFNCPSEEALEVVAAGS